jgi:hypothetical protein
MQKSLKSSTFTGKSRSSPPGTTETIVIAKSTKSINSTTSRPSSGRKQSRPSSGRKQNRPSPGRKQSRPQSGCNKNRHLLPPTLLSPVPGYVSVRVKKMMKGFGFGLVSGEEHDVWFKTTPDNRISGDNNALCVGDIFWGKLVKARNGKIQLHQIMSNEFMNREDVNKILEASRYKNVSQLDKLSTSVTKSVCKIEAKPSVFERELSHLLNTFRGILGSSKLCLNQGTIQIPMTCPKNMVDFFVQVINKDVTDDDVKNLTAKEFARFELDIQEYVKGKKGMGSLSIRQRKQFKRKPITRSQLLPLMDNVDFVDTMFRWVEKNDLLAMFFRTRKTVDVKVTSGDKVYEVPVAFKNIVSMRSSKHGTSPIQVIRQLMTSSVSIHCDHPTALRIQMGTVGEFALAVISRLNQETRVAVQPILRDALENVLRTLRCSSDFIREEGLNVTYNRCFSALKFVGITSAQCGQDYLRSTTDKKQFLTALIAQLSLTTHQSFRLEQSYFGKMVMPFCLGKWTNSDELLKVRAKEKILGFIRMLRTRKVFLMHKRAVAISLEYTKELLQVVKENEQSKTERVVEKVSKHRRQGSVFKVSHKKKSPTQILKQQLKFISCRSHEERIASFPTGYGQTVAEMRERHMNRISADDTGKFISVCPDVPDLREFLCSKPDPVEVKAKDEKVVPYTMVYTEFMERDRVKQNVRGAKIARDISAKRREQEIDETMCDYELSYEDAAFYVDNRDMVDGSYGSSIQEKIDDAHMYLDGPDEDEDYWNDEY